MKVKKILGLCLAAMMLVFALAACGKSAAGDDKLVGKWEYKLGEISVMTYEFQSDGTCIIALGEEEAGRASYTAKDGKITVESDGEKQDMAYKLDGDTLTLTVEGEDLPLTKVK